MMVQTTIQVSSEDYYSCVLTARIPVRVAIVTINGDTGFGIVEPLAEGETAVRRYVEELRNSQSTVEVEVTHKSPEAYWTRVVHRLETESIYETILASGCMTRLPIVIEGGIQYHSILSPSRETLSELVHNLKARFDHVKFKRMKVIPTSPFQSLLTKKQDQAFRLAFETGYYEMPRKSNLVDLSKELGIKRVAMQERMRRAELRIMTRYAESSF